MLIPSRTHSVLEFFADYITNWLNKCRHTLHTAGDHQTIFERSVFENRLDDTLDPVVPEVLAHNQGRLATRRQVEQL